MKEVFFTHGHLERIKRDVASGREPFAAAYAEMVKNAETALDQEALTVTRKGPGEHEYWTDSPYGGWNKVDGGPDKRDGEINPQADRGDYYAAIALDNAVRNLGLGYVFEGREDYAEKAVSLIRTWCLDPKTYMTPSLTNEQSPIELFITIPGIFLGGGLCEKSTAWKAGEWDAWLDWVKAFTVSVTERPFTNNFANWKNVLVSISAIVQDDPELLEHSFQAWRDLIPDQVGEDGHLTREIGRTKSLNYSTYGLNAMIQVAVIAEKRGVDLFGYTLDDGRGIERVLDFHVLYVVDSEAWPYEQISPYKGDNIALFELAHSWRQKDTYRAAVEKFGRPMFEHRVAGPVTLTNGVAFG
jgi:hypothetical protein